MDRIFTNNNPENPVDPVQISFFLAQTGCGSANGAALMKLHSYSSATASHGISLIGNSVCVHADG